MKIYTKNGDKGKTSLCGGHRVLKSDLRVEAYGTVDELSAHIGLLVSLLSAENKYEDVHAVIPFLEQVQQILFTVGSSLASEEDVSLHLSSLVQEQGVLEDKIDFMTAQMPVQHSFILPGGTVFSAQCHVCRTVCRRAERCIVALCGQHDVSQDILSYMNRLSDYFFILSRYVNFQAGVCEKIWKKTCR
ncbi:MAG: cob(I)yrinic acid a,c-diamide adenosyltransferase [Prevotella sp.]|nr:cob(I)yrinic acid a,c-diamide adenosyltransferase [Prevotella sp.]